MTRTQHTYIDIRFANSKRITRWLGWNILFLCVCVVSISIHINLAVYIARPLFPISYMNEYFGMEALFKKNTRYIYIYTLYTFVHKNGFWKQNWKLLVFRMCRALPPPWHTHLYFIYYGVRGTCLCRWWGRTWWFCVCMCMCCRWLHFRPSPCARETNYIPNCTCGIQCTSKRTKWKQKKKHAKISLSWNKCVLAGLCCLSA